MNSWSQRGSAITEAILALFVMVPLFWAVDHLGRLAEIKRDTFLGARYAAWQSLAQPPRPRSSTAALGHTLRDRIHGSEHAPVLAHQQLKRIGYSRDVMRDSRHKPLTNERHPPEVTRLKAGGERRLPANGLGTANLAHGRHIPAATRIAGLSGRMLDLPEAPLTVYRHRTPLAHGALGSEPTPPRKTARPPAIRATAGLLRESWRARSDAEYQRRAERIVASEPVAFLSEPAPAIGRFPIFKEGRYAQADDFIPPSRLQPR